MQLLRKLQSQDFSLAFFLNLSAHSLNDRSFFRDFIDYLEKHAELAPNVVLELSYTDLQDLNEDSRRDLLRLSKLGYRFSLDGVLDMELDLSMLKQHLFDFVKIDANVLLESGEEAEEGGSKVRQLKQMLDENSIDLIVEKIETEQMLVELLDFNIDFGQGFLFGEPRLSGQLETPPRRAIDLQAATADITAMNLSKITGMAAIADAYDLFVVDQWGVLHDGSKVHPGAVEALRALKDAGKTVVVLSNSGKPAGHSYERMEALGIDRSLYADVVTSGEDVRRHLARRPDPFYAALGRRFFIFAWDADRSLTDGLDYDEVDRIEDADFVIAAGTNRDPIDAYRADLEAAHARDLPMICANPDLISVQPDGTLKMCPGAIANAYEDMGGTVRWHGKPTRSIYELCFEVAGSYANGIGVGDSLLHDIKGAENAGLDSVFVVNGIHRNDLGPQVTEGELAALANKHGTAPTFALCRFVW